MLNLTINILAMPENEILKHKVKLSCAPYLDLANCNQQWSHASQSATTRK
jgi:hypothetical protein